MKVLVIGGVAAGTKAAAKLKRLNPDSQVTILTKSGIFPMRAAVCPITWAA